MSEKCVHKGKEPHNKAKKAEEEKRAAEKAEEKAEQAKSKRAKRKERKKERQALHDAEEANKTADTGTNVQQPSLSEASEVDSPVKLGPLAARRMRVG